MSSVMHVFNSPVGKDYAIIGLEISLCRNRTCIVPFFVWPIGGMNPAEKEFRRLGVFLGLDSEYSTDFRRDRDSL